MSTGTKQPSFNELLEDLHNIEKINERVNSIDIIRIKELQFCLHDLIKEKLNFIDKNSSLPYSWDWWQHKFISNHFTLYQLENLNSN